MLKYITKTCEKHGETKFVLEGRGYYRCVRCRASATARRRKKMKRALVDARGGACTRCGYNKCINALEFHHKDSAQKDFNLSQAGRTPSLATLKKEAEKCELVCANCHREIHDEINVVRAQSGS
jgi:hypothetical protein